MNKTSNDILSLPINQDWLCCNHINIYIVNKTTQRLNFNITRTVQFIDGFMVF